MFDIKNLLNPNREEVQHLEQPQKEEKKDNHHHEWDLLSKSYAAPRNVQPSDFDKVDQKTMDKMLFGVTVFLWECLICKTLRKEDVLGSNTTPLDELIDKAALYGPQYHQKDGETFQIAKVQKTVNPATLPMR